MTDTGILINKSNISIFMGIISVFAIIFATITTINSYTFRIDQLEIAQENAAVKLENQSKEFADKLVVFNTEISTLSDSIVSLTISLNILQERLKFVGNNGTNN